MIDWLRQPADPTIALGEHIYPLVIRRHPRAKRVIMRLTPDGRGVQVTLPPWGRTIDALRFAKTRSDWLKRQLAEQPDEADPLRDGVPYRGIAHEIVTRPDAPRSVSRQGQTLVIGGPAETATRRLQRWLEAECLRLSEPDLARYCTLADRPVPKLALSRAKRRWGSCSASGAVRINWRLVMAPDAVRRAVIAHEVAHLVHFDHSPGFHACLAGLLDGETDEGSTATYGGLNATEAWLKAYGRGLYRPFG